jgi:hypothetical protein
VTVTSHVDGTASQVTVTPKQLGLQPIDLLFAAAYDSGQAMTDLDDRVWHHLSTTAYLHPLDDFRIEYMVPGAVGGISFFDVGALLRSLRFVLLKSRHLGPDALAPSQARLDGPGGFDAGELSDRVIAARDRLLDHVATLTALAANTTEGIDAFVRKVAKELLAVSMHGVPHASPGELFGESRRIFRGLAGKLRAVVERWDGRVAAYDALLASLPAAATDDQRFDLLSRMETSVAPALTSPRPASPAAYAALVAGRRAALDQLHARLRAHLATATVELEVFLPELLVDVGRIGEFDSLPFDQEAKANDLGTEDQLVARLRDLAKGKLTQLVKDVAARGVKATGLIGEAASKAAVADQVALLLAAGKALLGEEFPLLPRFRLTAEQGHEVALALGATDQLLKHQVETLKRDFPVDDWLHGIARVKEKLFHWENILFLSDALGSATRPTMSPLQLPFQPNDSWIALELPDDYKLEGEKLAYTVHLATPFNAANLQAGLVVDEWTDLLPSKDEVTGLTFHYDQPNTEPPQVMLLMVPPTLGEREGRWKWDDVVDGVRETFDMARKRAVEPAQLDASPYAQLLPATLMAVTLHQVTLATNLAVNNRVGDDLAKLS